MHTGQADDDKSDIYSSESAANDYIRVAFNRTRTLADFADAEKENLRKSNQINPLQNKTM